MRRLIQRKLRELLEQKEQREETAAIVLSGGGARAAYQVGVLKYIADAFPHANFSIMAGVSAGAINIGQLANNTESFKSAAEELVVNWKDLHIDNVFSPESTLNFFRKLLMNGSGKSSEERITNSMAHQRGLADTSPLRAYLTEHLGVGQGGVLEGVLENIKNERLKAVAFTTTNYSTGQTTTFLDGINVTDWVRPNRIGSKTTLTLDHIMASAALPLIFPAVRIGGSWYGDGGMRLTSPFSPPINMGADRIFVISTRYNRSQDEANKPSIHGYPPAAQIIGILMNAIFLDVLDHDALRLERINELIKDLPRDKRKDLRPIKLLLIRPSRDIGQLAKGFKPDFSGALRLFTSGIGSDETDSPDWLSMLLFQEDYVETLIEVGYEDGASHHDEIASFFESELVV